ncbi:MAG: MarR family transcriptional regulator [Coriobacteriales bacterium]|nr:MarR family transcriptional regulator [Coriobacteriales bacterium]
MTREILHDLGFFGHYLHMHAGGRGGKQFVLTNLHKNGSTLTQRELLERTNTSPAALSEVLAKLESGGLIVREPYEHDKRQLQIELTQEGEVCAAQMFEQREQFEQRALACLSADEQAQLKELLERLIEHWNHLDEEKEVRA